jgi:hypothetical protein
MHVILHGEDVLGQGSQPDIAGHHADDDDDEEGDGGDAGELLFGLMVRVGVVVIRVVGWGLSLLLLAGQLLQEGLVEVVLDESEAVHAEFCGFEVGRVDDGGLFGFIALVAILLGFGLLAGLWDYRLVF